MRPIGLAGHGGRVVVGPLEAVLKANGGRRRAELGTGATVLEIYAGSDGQATMDLYARLEKLGSIGVVALNLFRAQKASSRAKVYRRRFKGMAYEKKNWSLQLLCNALTCSAAQLGIEFGWRIDPAQEYHQWVLYADLPTGQVSFHSATPLSAQKYEKPWDSSGDSASRIIEFVQRVVDRSELDWRQAEGGMEDKGSVDHDHERQQGVLL